MILEEEYKEATSDTFGWGVCACSGLAIVAWLGGESIHAANAGLGFATACVAMFSAVCAVGYLRCRRTIKAWRDQKRLEIAQREVEKMGGGR
jgi:hypothetical protein